MPRRPRPVARISPLAFQQRTIAATSAVQAQQAKEEAEQLETKVTSLESDPFFVTLDGGGPVVELSLIHI